MQNTCLCRSYEAVMYSIIVRFLSERMRVIKDKEYGNWCMAKCESKLV